MLRLYNGAEITYERSNGWLDQNGNELTDVDLYDVEYTNRYEFEPLLIQDEYDV